MNPLIQKAQAGFMAKVPQQYQQAVQKAVTAGKLVMYDKQKGLQMFMQQMQSGINPENIGAGVAKLIGILFNKSNKTMPMQVAIPAASLLLCEGLQFLEDAGKVKVDADFLAECMKAMGSAVLQVFGVSPQKLQQIVGSAQGGQPAQPAQPPQGAMPPAPPPGGIVTGAQ
jgi:hypothetical protein